MLAINLINYVDRLTRFGLVRSKRDFARRWLQRGPTFIRDYEFRSRGWNRLKPATVSQLRANLSAVAAYLPDGLAAEVAAVIEEIDRDERIASVMDEWRR